MATDQRDALEVLRFELYLIEQGAYHVAERRAAPLAFFKDSPTCLDFGENDGRNSCRNCLLSEFIPGRYQNETAACHRIPLDAAGNTIHSLGGAYNRVAVEQAVFGWLKGTVTRIECDRREESARCL